MEPRVIQLAPNEFRFEYENQKSVPKIVKGQNFKFEGKVYHIVHFTQIFGEKVYCSFLVIAKAV